MEVTHIVQVYITNSDLNRPCFAWHPYMKLGLFKTELVIVLEMSCMNTKKIHIS